MRDRSDQVGWTDAQWNRVRQVVTETAARGRVAASFLPTYGPLPRSTQVVPSERFDESTWAVDDTATAPLVELESNFTLSEAQTQDEDLSSVLQLMRRATSTLVRLEDWTIFNGQQQLYGDWQREPRSVAPVPGIFRTRAGERPDWGEYFSGAIVGFERSPSGVSRYVTRVIRRRNRNQYEELSALAQNPREFSEDHGFAEFQDRFWRMRNRLLEKNPGALGLIDAAYNWINGVDLDPDGLLTSITGALTSLESRGHLGPFACVLGDDAFVAANRPVAGSLVLPRDRIEPILGRELLRSSAIDDRQFEARTVRGVVISLGGDAIDIAVAVDAEPEFLFVDEDGDYHFRVHERFALRIKQPTAIVRITFNPVAGLVPRRASGMWR